MYYHKVLRCWILDSFDYLLLAGFFGSLLGEFLKKYWKEKLAMRRLKNSIIQKSVLKIKQKPVLKYETFKQKKRSNKIKQIYRFGLDTRGGQSAEDELFEKLLKQLLKDLYPSSTNTFHIAQEIQFIIQQLASVLKEKELDGVFGKFFFRNGRLILEIVLKRFNISIIYCFLNEGLDNKMIAFTSLVGGTLGFTASWLYVGTTLIMPSLLLSTFLSKSIIERFLHHQEYLSFKNNFSKLLEQQDEIKQKFQAFLIEEPSPIAIKLEKIKNKVYLTDYDLKSTENFEQFLKARTKEEFGFTKMPSEIQFKKIRPKAKTALFRNLISETQGSNLLDSDITYDEIKQIAIKIDLDN